MPNGINQSGQAIWRMICVAVFGFFATAVCGAEEYTIPELIAKAKPLANKAFKLKIRKDRFGIEETVMDVALESESRYRIQVSSFSGIEAYEGDERAYSERPTSRQIIVSDGKTVWTEKSVPASKSDKIVYSSQGEPFGEKQKACYTSAIDKDELVHYLPFFNFQPAVEGTYENQKVAIFRGIPGDQSAIPRIERQYYHSIKIIIGIDTGIIYSLEVRGGTKPADRLTTVYRIYDMKPVEAFPPATFTYEETRATEKDLQKALVACDAASKLRGGISIDKACWADIPDTFPRLEKQQLLCRMFMARNNGYSPGAFTFEKRGDGYHLRYKEKRLTDIAMLRGMPIASLELSGSNVSVIPPLASAVGLSLNLLETPLSDLSSLKDTKLKELWFGTKKAEVMKDFKGWDMLDVSDLEKLFVFGSTIDSLENLRNAKHLREIELIRTNVQDLSPLADCPVERIKIIQCKLKDLSSLQNIKTLKSLQVCSIKEPISLAPLAGLPLEFLAIQCEVADYMPLGQVKTLAKLYVPDSPILCEQIKPLAQQIPNCTINGGPILIFAALKTDDLELFKAQFPAEEQNWPKVAENMLGTKHPLSHQIAMAGAVKIFAFLQGNGVSIESPATQTQKTLLFSAASYGRLAFAEYLLEQGAQVNALDKYNSTPLDAARCYNRFYHDKDGCKAIEKLLLEKGGQTGKELKDK